MLDGLAPDLPAVLCEGNIVEDVCERITAITQGLFGGDGLATMTEPVGAADHQQISLAHVTIMSPLADA